MRVVDKLKLNKFRDVAIPTPRDLFARYGVAIPRNTTYSGDEMAINGMSKIDSISSAELYDRYKQQLESVPFTQPDVVDSSNV